RRESAPRALRLLEQRARGGRGVHLLLTRSATSDKRKEVTHEHHEKADRTPRRTRAAPLRVGRRPDRSGGTRTPGDLLQRSGPGRIGAAPPADDRSTQANAASRARPYGRALVFWGAFTRNARREVREGGDHANADSCR